MHIKLKRAIIKHKREVLLISLMFIIIFPLIGLVVYFATAPSTNEQSKQVISSSKKKMAFIMAGQSNNVFGRTFGDNPQVSGELDSGVKQLGELEENKNLILPAGVSTIQFTDLDGTRHGFGYFLAKKIKDHLNLDEILIVPIARGGTGWSNNYWTPGTELQRDLLAKTRLAVSLGYDIAGMTWSQGETDSVEPFASAYPSLLAGVVSSIRTVAYNSGQENAYKIPFVTFDMVEEWVQEKDVVVRRKVQNALERINEDIPYTSNIDSTNLTPKKIDDDIIHYDTPEHFVLAERFFEAWKKAILNSKPSNYTIPTHRKVLLHRAKKGSFFSDKWSSLSSIGTSETDNLYSRLGEAWKYVNNGKIRFQMEWDVIDGETENIVWEQELLPYTITSTLSNASLISKSKNAKFGTSKNSGFGGLTYHDGEHTLIKLDTTEDLFWGPVGLVSNVFTGSIPIFSNPQILASETRLYVIKQ